MPEAVPITSKQSRSDYESVIRLLGVFTKARHMLGALESRANKQLVTMAERHAHKFATLQTAAAEAESALKEIAARHPEWFPTDQRTLKTVFGQIHAQRVTSHDVPKDEEKAVTTIEAKISACRKEGRFDLVEQLERLIVTTKGLNVSAMGDIPEETLLLVGIARNITDSITVKEAKVNMGTAIKSTAKKKAKKEASTAVVETEVAA